MKVQPEICMKTKDRQNEHAPTHVDSGRFSWSFVPERHSGSSLLSLDPGTSKNAGATGDMYENKGSGECTSAENVLIPGDSVGASSQSGILAPRSCLPPPALQENEGATGDVVENTRSATRDTGTRDTGRVDSSLCPPRNAGPPVQQGAPAPVTGYPGNMLKTKVRQNPITHHKSPFANALSPDSALQRMKVQPEMLLKTHDRPPSAGRET